MIFPVYWQAPLAVVLQRFQECTPPSQVVSPGRYGHRDATLILIAFRHGLRVNELVALRWDRVDLEQGLLHVSRLKSGVPSTVHGAGPSEKRRSFKLRS